MGGKRVVLLLEAVLLAVLLSGFVFGVDENIILSTYLDEEIYVGQEYTKLFKIEIDGKKEARGCSEKDLITVRYNITNGELVKEDIFSREIGCSGYASTGEFTPSLAGDYVLCGEIINSTVEESDFRDNFACMNFTVLDTSAVVCDIELNIVTDGVFVYQEGESIKFKTELNGETFPFEIEYWIEDLFGNIYKKHYVSANTNQKSWKTNIDEEDRILLIKARVNASCNDTDLSNNYDEEMFVVVGSAEVGVLEEVPKEEQELNSSIEILDVSPDSLEFGDIVKAKINVYRGETGKYAVYAYVEKNGKKISEKVTMHFKDKFTDYTLTVPIQLKPNCDSRIKDGEANLVVEGLGEKAEEEITVSGVSKTFCKESSGSNSDEKEKKLSYQIVDLPISVFAGESLNVVVELIGDSKEHDFKAWSYLYRGSKCYSCETGERDGNLVEFGLDENEDKEIKLLVEVDNEIEEGEYKLKVKLNKDGQKTNKELTESIYVKGKNGEVKEIKESLDLLSGDLVDEGMVSDMVPKTSSEKKEILNKVKKVIYESSSEKAKKWIPHLIIAVLGLLCLILGWKRI